MFNYVVSCTVLLYSKYLNRIGTVIVSVLTSSAVDHRFDLRYGHFKDYKIGVKQQLLTHSRNILE